ncbi:MAG: hypothetical protein DME95_07215 [Verrucomicrobia bacterium]|nr:MAG: hypothetical protein DME95_07215 [Verrucomicrobiota bacterium]
MSVANRLRILAIVLALLTVQLDANEGQKQSLGPRSLQFTTTSVRALSARMTLKRGHSTGGSLELSIFSDDRGYIRSKVTKKLIPRPVIENGRSVKGDVRIVFVVNQEGRAVMPFVVHSTNRKLNKTVLDIITQWRGTPALDDDRDHFAKAARWLCIGGVLQLAGELVDLLLQQEHNRLTVA